MVVHIAGAGAAGISVAQALLLTGRSLGSVACRDMARARKRCDVLGGGIPSTLDTMQGDPNGAPCLLIVSVPDRHIADIAAALSERPWPRESVALHLSGSVDVEALAPLRTAGFAVGSLHPLKSFVGTPTASASPLADIVCALEGDPAALEAAQELAIQAGGRPFRLATGGRAAWHAGATHACNHLVALVDQALDLLQQAGLDRDTGRSALLPLLRSTVENLRVHQPGQALTGPVVRGDADVVARHLVALQETSPELASAYKALARRALNLAREERNLDQLLAKQIEITLNGEDE